MILTIQYIIFLSKLSKAILFVGRTVISKKGVVKNKCDPERISEPKSGAEPQ